MYHIEKIIKHYGIKQPDTILYSENKAKLLLSAVEKKSSKKNSSLILVTAVSPTKSGEGKTTVSIGLSQALNKHGVKSVLSLREPSMGPVFGVKGGATGGGKAKLFPSNDINLHFNGDIHAITSANNLLAAAIDNHIYFGNSLRIDQKTISFKRCLDMNDRSLRDKFDITAASEMMAIVCLSKDMKDLRKRIARIVVAQDTKGNDIYAKDLKAVGVMMAILKDAMMPNIVATEDGCLAFIHGGPFGNIAHGCSSILATRAALTYGDVCITEAGFGADLGAEKFFNIKLRAMNEGSKEKMWPRLVVIVATLKSIKEQGDGYSNLARHIENMQSFGCEVVVAINKFKNDLKKELDALINYCDNQNVDAFVIDCFGKGKDGGDEIARHIKGLLKNKVIPKEKYLYTKKLPIRSKIKAIAKNIYRAKDVVFTKEVETLLKILENSVYKDFPVCIAKNQYSFTDNEKLLGAPTNHTFHVNDLRLYAGSGFITVYAGKIFTMPGLSRSPSLERIDVDSKGNIVGLK